MNVKKILFIVQLYADRSPCQRFRFEQYLDYFGQNGYECTFSGLVSKKDDKIFYSKGKVFRKFLLLIKFIFKRLRDIFRAGKYDIIFIQREAFVLGSTVFEKWLSKKRAKLIYDFDDAIWLYNISEANKKFDWLKKPHKTSKIISYADLVIAGNRFLADYAKQFNNHVFIVPTTINTEEYKPSKTQVNSKICIGWSGSVTTIEHFKYAIPFLRTIRQKYKDDIVFKVIGDAAFRNEELGITGIAWKKENEIAELNTFDIGIMPLPDTEWARGKCGLKGLQYMALEIPTIMSPVGVNSEIIKDGENGFLAAAENEWVEKISRLIESEALRKSMGKKGRDTVFSKYSYDAQKDVYLDIFEKLLKI